MSFVSRSLHAPLNLQGTSTITARKQINHLLVLTERLLNLRLVCQRRYLRRVYLIKMNPLSRFQEFERHSQRDRGSMTFWSSRVKFGCVAISLYPIFFPGTGNWLRGSDAMFFHVSSCRRLNCVRVDRTWGYIKSHNRPSSKLTFQAMDSAFSVFHLFYSAHRRSHARRHKYVVKFFWRLWKMVQVKLWIKVSLQDQENLGWRVVKYERLFRVPRHTNWGKSLPLSDLTSLQKCSPRTFHPQIQVVPKKLAKLQNHLSLSTVTKPGFSRVFWSCLFS